MNYSTKFKNKDAFYIYFGYKECPYCRAFSPVMKELPNATNIQVLYFNLDQNFSSTLLDKVNDYLDNDLQLTGTPTIAYYKNGIISGKLSGADKGINDIVNLSNITRSTS